MKIIITGATGSLGAYLTRWFSMRGHEIYAVGRIANPPARLFSHAKYIRADITVPYKLPQADLCIHAAAIADDRASEEELYRANVKGTEHTADAARDCHTFIHVSSSSVYANSETPLSENHTGEKRRKSLSLYGRSKLLAEDTLIRRYANERCFVLRPRGIYGAGDKVLLPRLLRLVRDNMMIRAGNMDVKLSMTHFANFATAVESCILSERTGLNIYNVADNEVYVLYQVIKKLIAEIYGKSLQERKIPLWILKCLAALHIGEVTPLLISTVSKNLVLDIDKIKTDLGYAPVTNFDIGVKEIGEWVRTVGGIEVVKGADTYLAWET